jgi:hypothetical protein
VTDAPASFMGKGAVLGSTALRPSGIFIRSINEHGRMNWQKGSGYNRRSKAEAAIGRYKRVIGLPDKCSLHIVIECAVSISHSDLVVRKGFLGRETNRQN